MKQAREVRTTCPYCGVGCGVIARIGEDGAVEIRGDQDHPANFGRLCSKGAALAETLELNGRLLHPEVGGRRVDWDTALDTVAQGFARTLHVHGPESVAFYVSGQLLTEDYYIANKLMKGFIGTANIDTNSRLCMASSVAAHQRAFGSDTVPGCYEDLELADLVVLAGSNLAWCHPVLFQRLRKAKEEQGRKVVAIDPRRTATSEIADLHLPIAPGADAWLWNGLLHFLQGHGKVDYDFLEHHVEGYAAALRAARESSPSIPAVAARCGLPEEDVARFFHLFARTDKTVTVYSQGLNQSSSGTDKVNAIINCHLLTGRIGRPGMGPFSVTGQPNAMGGREVGGMANQLAAHLSLDNPAHRDRVQRFWDSPRIAERAGLKAVELFDAIGDGRIKAIWIMGTNPVVSLPEADRARATLARCPLVVVSDCMRDTDTTQLAHVLLPALTWGEKDGTVTNSERCISRQRAFLPPPGEARPDWWIVSEVASRMGFERAFRFTSPAQIFREHAELSGFGSDGSRDFDLSGLAQDNYDRLEPVQWPVTRHRPTGTARMFAGGRFFTPSGKAQLIPVVPRLPPRLPHAKSDDGETLVLNTGRIRDQWHTMTRTGNVPRLMAHIAEPFAELHPQDARRLGIENNGLVRVSNSLGEVMVRARLSADQRPGSVFVPMHWNDQFTARARIDTLVPAVVDPISGQPESKHARVNVAPFPAAWYGFVLSHRDLAIPPEAAPVSVPSPLRGRIEEGGSRFDETGEEEAFGRDGYYWARIPGRNCWRFELAGTEAPPDWAAWARNLALIGCQEGGDAEWLEYLDTAAGRYRAARLVDGRLDTCVMIAPRPDLPGRQWLESLFGSGSLSPVQRANLLMGRPPAGQPDAGVVVCACFQVGRNAIIDAIQRDGLATPAAIGQALKAGTQCGSCIPELQRLIAELPRVDKGQVGPQTV